MPPVAGPAAGVLAVADTLKDGAAGTVARLHAQGLKIAMITGDNQRTASAIAAATGIGTGIDVAIQASDLTLMRGDLDGVPAAILLSRRTYRTIRQNLFWAFGYNSAAIPLAALGLLSPVIAGAAMGLSSVSVVINSLRLLRFHGDPRPLRKQDEPAPQTPGHRVVAAHAAEPDGMTAGMQGTAGRD